MHETIVYGVKATGHDVPENERKIVLPPVELEQLLKTWLKIAHSKRNPDRSFADLQDLAYDLLEGLPKVSVAEAHALLQPPHNTSLTGVFVSAIYNTLCDEDIIVYDLELPSPPGCMAYRLAEGKTFVNLTSIGSYSGKQAKGTLVNYGITEHGFGFDADVVINLGKTDISVGHGRFGIVLNYGKLVPEVEYSITHRGTVFIHAGQEAIAIRYTTWGARGWSEPILFLITSPNNTTLAAEPKPNLKQYIIELGQQLQQSKNNPEAIKKIVSSFLTHKKFKITLDGLVDTDE